MIHYKLYSALMPTYSTYGFVSTDKIKRGDANVIRHDKLRTRPARGALERNPRHSLAIPRDGGEHEKN